MSEKHVFCRGCQDERVIATWGAGAYSLSGLATNISSPVSVTQGACDSTNTHSHLNILGSAWRAGLARHLGFAEEKWSDQSVTPTSSSQRSLDELLTTQQRKRDIARLGAYAMHAKHGSEPQRKSFNTRMRRYEQQIDPSGDLARRNPQELARRVDAALKADMARVRLGRATHEQTLRQMLARTPANDLAQVGAIVTALALTSEESSHSNSDSNSSDDSKKEVASVEAETTSTPRIQRKHPNSFSSDGGKDSVTRAPRRRQTSPDNSPKMPTGAKEKKAAKHHHDHINNNTPTDAPSAAAPATTAKRQPRRRAS